MIYNGFEYNEFGVCLNPDIPYQYGKYPKAYFEITVSETSQGWTYGYDWNWLTSGGGGPCSCLGRTIFKSKPEAIVAAAEFIKTIFERRHKNKEIIAELDRIISEESKPTVKQYTIFDYL